MEVEFLHPQKAAEGDINSLFGHFYYFTIYKRVKTVLESAKIRTANHFGPLQALP